MIKKIFTLTLVTVAFVAVSCQQADGEQTNKTDREVQAQLSFGGPKPEDALVRLGKSSANTLAFAPDGNTVIAGGDAGVFAYSAATLEELWNIPTLHPIVSLAVSPNGQLLAAGLENGSAILIEMENRGVIDRTLYENGTDNGLYSLAWYENENAEDGQYLALGFNDGNVIISQILRDSTAGEIRPDVTLLENLEQQSSGVVSMAFNPNGTVLATGTRNGSISIWETETWQWLGFLEGHETAHAVSTLDWSDDGQLLLSGGRDDLLILWDMTTLQPRALIPDQAGDTMVVNFAPGGNSIAAVSAGGEVTIWDLSSQEPQISSEHQLGEVGSIAWSDGWDTIVSATTDGELLAWDIKNQSDVTGPKKLLLGHSKRGDWVTRVAWDSSGSRLASVLDEDVLVWDNETNSLLQRFGGHDALVGGLDWSADGTKIASGDADGVIKIWDAASGTGVVTIDAHNNGITDLRWSPNGTYLASAGSLDDTIVLIDPTSGDVLHRLSGLGSGIWSVAWSPEGNTVAGGSTNGEVLFWDLDQMEEAEPSQVMPRHLNWVSGISFSPDGKWLATSGADNRLVLTDLRSEKAFTYPGHQGAVRSVEFSPDGTRLASGARDNLVIIWDVSEPGTNKEPLAVYAGHTNGVNDVRWSQDGQKIASGSDDGTVLIWPGME